MKTYIFFIITDHTSAITVKCFPRPKDLDTVLYALKRTLFSVRGEDINETLQNHGCLNGLQETNELSLFG